MDNLQFLLLFYLFHSSDPSWLVTFGSQAASQTHHDIRHVAFSFWSDTHDGLTWTTLTSVCVQWSHLHLICKCTFFKITATFLSIRRPLSERLVSCWKQETNEFRWLQQWRDTFPPVAVWSEGCCAVCVRCIRLIIYNHVCAFCFITLWLMVASQRAGKRSRLRWIRSDSWRLQDYESWFDMMSGLAFSFPLKFSLERYFWTGDKPQKLTTAVERMESLEDEVTKMFSLSSLLVGMV